MRVEEMRLSKQPHFARLELFQPGGDLSLARMLRKYVVRAESIRIEEFETRNSNRGLQPLSPIVSPPASGARLNSSVCVCRMLRTTSFSWQRGFDWMVHAGWSMQAAMVCLFVGAFGTMATGHALREGSSRYAASTYAIFEHISMRVRHEPVVALAARPA